MSVQQKTVNFQVIDQSIEYIRRLFFHRQRVKPRKNEKENPLTHEQMMRRMEYSYIARSPFHY